MALQFWKSVSHSEIIKTFYASGLISILKKHITSHSPLNLKTIFSYCSFPLIVILLATKKAEQFYVYADLKKSCQQLHVLFSILALSICIPRLLRPHSLLSCSPSTFQEPLSTSACQSLWPPAWTKQGDCHWMDFCKMTYFDSNTFTGRDLFGLQRSIQIFVCILRTGGKWLRTLPGTNIA